MSTEDIVVGIDLGTTNTCAAYFLNGNLSMLENAEGKYTTPSYVFFADKERIIVGDNGKRIAANKPEHGIYEIKRLIGRQYHEIESQQNLEELSFVVKNLGDQPQVFFEQFNYTYKTPEQICAHILKKIKTDISKRLGTNIDKAVVTVPAHFNVSQRKATLKSAEMAGFTVLKLLSEPTAAALNYFYETNNDKGFQGNYCLVYDLGGGTFDVALLERDEDNINIVCVDGDSHLGGHDFDNLILKFLCQELETRYNYKQKLNKTALRRLKNASISAKEALSAAKQISVDLEGFLGFDAVDIMLTRQQFEEMAHHLFQRSIQIVDKFLQNSKLSKSDVDQVILAGGSTRIPKIQQLLQEYFDGKSPNKMLHPDHCVAMGAALQAAMLSTNPQQNTAIFKIHEVISSSLGTGDVTNKMNFVIKRNTFLPTSGSIKHATITDNQQAISLEIYEGERMDVRKNICLGTLKITDLTPAPPGQCKVNIKMNVDHNGILTITAKEKHKKNIKNLQIALVREQHSYEVLPNSQDEEDERFLRFTKLKEFLISYGEGIEYNFRANDLTNAHQDVYVRCRQIQMDVLQAELSDEEKLLNLWEEIVRICTPFVEAYNFRDMPSGTDIVK